MGPHLARRTSGLSGGHGFPAWAGNSAITGHVYVPNGWPGRFVRLAELAYGDEIIVRAFGMRFVYSVREVRRV
jgi:sortase (surface protein transpeptidase)